LQLLSLVSNSLRKEAESSNDLETLQETIDKIIDLTRTLSDYNQELSCQSDIDFEDLFATVSGTQLPLFADKGITLHIAIGKTACGAAVRGDAAMLDVAITCILKNALEATESGGRVSLEAEALPYGATNSSVVQIRVTDYGCGIPQEHLNKIVEPFFTTKKDHDGLGLSMASRFVEMHGGFLTIDSPSGQGTEAVIRLPVRLSRERLQP
jgi:signal transduction histidine kinase